MKIIDKYFLYYLFISLKKKITPLKVLASPLIELRLASFLQLSSMILFRRLRSPTSTSPLVASEDNGLDRRPHPFST